MTMRITVTEQEIDIKSKKVEWGDLFKYLSTSTMKEGNLKLKSKELASC